MGIQIAPAMGNSEHFVLSIGWDDMLLDTSSSRRGVELLLSEETLDALKQAIIVKETFGQCV